MNSQNKKLVIFDFDGVLVDTLGVCLSINQEYNDNLSLEEFKNCFNGNLFKAERENGRTFKTHLDFGKKYDLKSRNIIIPEILKLTVEELSKNYILTIVSSSFSESIKKILERENILDCFSDVLGVDVDKDKVVKNNLILKKYNTSPNNAVFITDTLGDVLEARECEIRAIAVTWGFQERKILEKGNPVSIIDDPRDLLKKIDDVLK